MDVLADAAEAEADSRADDEHGTYADDRDPGRGDLPSDAEDGPDDPDDDADALAPGDVDGAGETVGDDVADDGARDGRDGAGDLVSMALGMVR